VPSVNSGQLVPISRELADWTRKARAPTCKSLLRMPGKGARKENGRQSRPRSVATIAKKIANSSNQRVFSSSLVVAVIRRRRSGEGHASVIRCYGRSPQPPKKLEKTALVAAYLRSSLQSSALTRPRLPHFSSGRPFRHTKKRLCSGGALLWRVIGELSEIEHELTEIYRRHGDADRWRLRRFPRGQNPASRSAKCSGRFTRLLRSVDLPLKLLFYAALERATPLEASNREDHQRRPSHRPEEKSRRGSDRPAFVAPPAKSTRRTCCSAISRNFAACVGGKAKPKHGSLYSSIDFMLRPVGLLKDR